MSIVAYNRRGAAAVVTQVLGQQHTASSKSDADTNETALYTLTIPGGTIGANGTIEVLTKWTVPSSATNKLLRVRLGGIAGTAFMAYTATTVASFHGICYVHNRNSQSSQIGQVAGLNTLYGASSSALTTGTIDTSVDTTLVISGQWGTGGAGANNITLESVLVRLSGGI